MNRTAPVLGRRRQAGFMSASRPRRKRAPVVSRLTLAWTTFALVASAVALYAIMWGARALKPERVALAVDGEVETMARSEPMPTRSALRPGAAGDRFPPALAEPPLRDGAAPEEPDYADAQDLLADGTTDTDDTLDVPSEVVITVDGQPARAPGEEVAPAHAASLGRSAAYPIPDAFSDLLQDTSFGKIPKIGAGGRSAANAYSKKWEGDHKRPTAAIIVGGLGLDPRVTARAIDQLPPEITLSFAPYAKDLEHWTAEARARGHEIMIELPMEGYGGSVKSLGPAGLLTSRTPAQNLQRLDWLLSRFGAYFGATNYFGGKFSADRASIAPVIERLKSLGLAYVDDTGAAASAFPEDGAATSVDRMIAPEGPSQTAEDVTRDLKALEAAAQKDGDALGKTFAYDASIDAIAAWAEGLDEDGIALAPASAVLKARAARS